jgi:hypothetical protein
MLFIVKPLVRYIKPRNTIRGFFYDVVMNSKFETTIHTIIVVNVLFMSLYCYPIDNELSNLLNLVNYVFVGIFSAEMVFKLVGLGPKSYFSNS